MKREQNANLSNQNPSFTLYGARAEHPDSGSNLNGTETDFAYPLPCMYTESFKVEEIAAIHLAVSEKNGCLIDISRCVQMARKVGFSELDILQIRMGTSNDPKLQALLELAISILHGKGLSSTRSRRAFYAAGFSYEALLDLMGIIVMCNLRNYLANRSAA